MRPYFARALILAFSAGLIGNAHASDQPNTNATAFQINVPSMVCNHDTLHRAFRIAVGDLVGNIQPYKNGLLKEPTNVILAGLDYGTPWTRDASMNSWNGASLLVPDVARSTLLCVLKETPDGIQIGGQYWDAIVWATGAWHHYLYTGDKTFLRTALTATKNTLKHREENEFDALLGLFRGPGWSDGVAGYPKRYTNPNGDSGILEWPQSHPDKASSPGYGIPMMALSTNCLYYNGYLTAEKMARELGAPVDPSWSTNAKSLKQSINKHLWNEETGVYRFFVDPWGGCDHQEALGHAYALLFGIADGKRVKSITKNLYVTPAGVPCEWPSFPRYDSPEGNAFARHAGTVWPQIQAMWADAMARNGPVDAFGHEINCLAEHAVRDLHFAEIYHPTTGEIYGGMQEKGSSGIGLWNATSRQTWAATGYLRMVLLGLVGMRVDTNGVTFEPCMPANVTHVELKNIHYRNMTIDITVHGQGRKCNECQINGKLTDRPFLDAGLDGHQTVLIVVQP